MFNISRPTAVVVSKFSLMLWKPTPTISQADNVSCMCLTDLNARSNLNTRTVLNLFLVQDGAKKRPTLEPDPTTAAVVNRIFGMAEAGRGILEITRTLNDEGIANPTGRLWSKNGVHIILKNEVYTGTLVWGVDAKDKAEPVRVEKAFPAIVSKAQFRRVNRKLRSRAPRRSHPRRVGNTYLLSGLVRCKACNRALSG